MTIVNFFGGCLVGLFLLGMLSKKANARGALTGFVIGFACVLFLAAATDIAYMWYSAINAILTYSIGWIMSVVLSKSRDRSQMNNEKLVYRWRTTKKVRYADHG